MGELASVLELTFNQVKGWFIERRRRDQFKYNSSLVNGSNHSKALNAARMVSGTKMERKKKQKKKKKKKSDGAKKLFLAQDLLTPGYILAKIFRKDGPPLGVEFDSLPSKGFHTSYDVRNSSLAFHEDQRANKRTKVFQQGDSISQDYSNSAPPVKHGMGKGLMTIWRATNPNGGHCPTGLSIADKEIIPPVPTPVPRKVQRRKKKQLVSILKQKQLEKKTNHKRKPSAQRREVEYKRTESRRQLRREKCELALEGVISQERIKQFEVLADDEELELRELQAGPNPRTCSDNCARKGLNGCSLCKDLLPKFPPNCVRMKQPFAKQPWDSSPERVKKLFKVFYFLYTHSVAIDICSFTLDDFAQAFHDKDSLLLGKIHLALLKLLLTDIETEMTSGCWPHLSISCKFLALLHSVDDQEYLLEFWKKSLNPLTWTEILRQVLVAAGFGSRHGVFQKETLSKEMSLMVKYGLRRGTLKGELFTFLADRGNNGLKIHDIAKSLQIAELNLASTTEELEHLISSTLSSDITLFEKISPSAYRLRIITHSKETDDFQSDTEDSGSVHDDFGNAGMYSGDSECESENPNSRKSKHIYCSKDKDSLRTVRNEIDESHPGEMWLLGLVEGEYSDLCIEEKLNALVALIDLLSAGSSVRIEDTTRPIDSAPNMRHYGSGAKIKRSSSMQYNFPRPSWVHVGQMDTAKESYTPIDSSFSILKFNEKDRTSSQRKDTQEEELDVDLHPMQSIFLGSDRRYNRYWLFLGPCNSKDPGHKRLYFESSEDGHWEVIDTEEALHALLSVLDDRGRREALLIESLEKREAFLAQEMSSRIRKDVGNGHLTVSDHSQLEIVREDSTSPVSDIDNNLCLTEVTSGSFPPLGAIILTSGNKEEDEHQKWHRLQEFDAWIWNYFYCNLNAVKRSKRSYFESLTRCETCHDLFWRDEKHCRFCHTTFELEFDLEERYAIHAATCRNRGEHRMPWKQKVMSSQLQSLKAAVHAIESSMPEDALPGAWRKSARRLWVKRLRRTSSLPELLQVVADFVAAINKDQLRQYIDVRGSNNFLEEITACFPTMPQTASALALWLVRLDNVICPYLERLQSEHNQENRISDRYPKLLS